MKQLNHVLGWFGFQWVEEGMPEDGMPEDAEGTPPAEQALPSKDMKDPAKALKENDLNKQVVMVSLTQVISNKLGQDVAFHAAVSDVFGDLSGEVPIDSLKDLEATLDLTQYVQLPALKLPEPFTEGLQRYLLGYPQHVKSLFYFETVQGETSQHHIGLLASDRNPKAGNHSENEINEDWLAVSFIPFLEGLLEQHLQDFPGELNLVLLDERPDLMSKVLHRIQPLYTSNL